MYKFPFFRTRPIIEQDDPGILVEDEAEKEQDHNVVLSVPLHP